MTESLYVWCFEPCMPGLIFFYVALKVRKPCVLGIAVLALGVLAAWMLEFKIQV